MSQKPEILALQQTYASCRGHAQILGEALADLQLRNLQIQDISHLSKEDRRILDQFAYRYTRLQDDIGARLLPAILRAMEEDIATMSVADRLNRLEQLGWLPSADEWSDLRRIRNEFPHDYPDTVAERFARLQMALNASQRALEILEALSRKIEQHFPDLTA
ncbi:hypothetical protein B1757_10740 [Acidithiobacillus marinus]|uniref:Toxin-antitoxin system antitoxin subunit n=1 Tax=Acidithiobacillus marinus TaxID=187490 RepID=A0A2I1DJZ3_9PROT|nr:hypothetical protein [Acidithiobacillus marinus]PKY10190.1 hypothetical protein B1757_10740 [Acidithiobacillus marinus]